VTVQLIDVHLKTTMAGVLSIPGCAEHRGSSMRKAFQEFYTPTPTEFQQLWAEGVFALDANVLLDVYRFSAQTTDQLIDILQQLDGRVWVPNQAALEYQRSRHHVSATVMEAYNKACGRLDAAFTELKEALRKNAESDSLLKPIEKAFDSAKQRLTAARTKHAKLVPTDRLHDRLTELLDQKVGPPYSASELVEKYEAAESRYKEKMPPGYKDAAKPAPDRYGDAIVWMQLLDHAKVVQKPVILISVDLK
jgi:hypothetical protein